MALNFPNNPNVNDTFTSGGITWTWDGVSWNGGLSSNSETDPVFQASPAANITTGSISNWDTAYGWGDHGAQGYLTSGLTLSDLSVNVAAAGSANLAYDNTNGVFTYTPPIVPAALANITDAVYGVDVAGKVAATDGMDIDIGGSINAQACTLDFSQCTISFSGASIGGLSGVIHDGVDFHLNQTTATNGQILSWNSTGGGAGTGDYEWKDAYTNADVDSHLNQSNPTQGYVLSWDGTDYAWVGLVSGGTLNLDGLTDVSIPTTPTQYEFLQYDGTNFVATYPSIQHLDDVRSDLNPTNNQLLQWDDSQSRYDYVTPSTILGQATGGTGSPSTGELLSWNGTDYEWITPSSVADNLDTITSRGSTTTNAISVGGVSLGDAAGNTGASSVTLGDTDEALIYYLGSVDTLQIQCDKIILRAKTGLEDPIISGEYNGAAKLYYSGTSKVETTSTGALIAGELTLSGSLSSSTSTLELKTVDSNNTANSITNVVIKDTGVLFPFGHNSYSDTDPNNTAISATSTNAGCSITNGGQIYIASSGSSDIWHGRQVGTNGWTSRITAAGDAQFTGTISDSIGPVRRLGINTIQANYTLQASDLGKVVSVTGASGAVTITLDDAVFSPGDLVTILNNGGQDVNIEAGANITVRYTDDASTGNRTMESHSMVTIMYHAANLAYVSGTRFK